MMGYCQRRNHYHFFFFFFFLFFVGFAFVAYYNDIIVLARRLYDVVPHHFCLFVCIIYERTIEEEEAWNNQIKCSWLSHIKDRMELFIYLFFFCEAQIILHTVCTLNGNIRQSESSTYFEWKKNNKTKHLIFIELRIIWNKIRHRTIKRF